MAAVNLGKVGDIELLAPLFKTASGDASTAVRREAAAAIGRMRHQKAIPALVHLTKDEDPKVALQALRGLLTFDADEPQIQAALADLSAHPNEMVQEALQREQAASATDRETRHQHAAAPDFLKNLVVRGDVFKILESAPADAAHLTFTSPPYYNARDYSIYASYETYLEFLEAVFRQVHRITKPGRFFVLNTSPVIVPRLSRQHSSRRYAIPFDIHPRLTKMGWDFIDDIVWAKPETSVKNRNGGFFQHRKPLGYKPNPRTEYLMVYRKKSARLIDWNIRQYDERQIQQSKVAGDYETSNVWNIDPTFNKKHPAVFPAELCKRVIKYYSFEGDLIFDPFGGSGTLGAAALALNRYFLMTEINAEYIGEMQKRFKSQSGFFNDRAPRFVDEQEFQQLAQSA